MARAYRSRHLTQETVMELKAGDVVVLKSGGQLLTVADVNDQTIECIWIGEEGTLFRETLPAVILELAHVETEDDEDENDKNGDDEEEDDNGEQSRAVA
jgi:uncharacterized protein YodC (DUF2158 family)